MPEAIATITFDQRNEIRFTDRVAVSGRSMAPRTVSAVKTTKGDGEHVKNQYSGEATASLTDGLITIMPISEWIRSLQWTN